jgi:pimeloyl-ACP methyl ester carboxylesterase
MTTISTPHSVLAFSRAGTQGDPAVLVHGSWSDHHVWDRVVPGLAPALQVLTYDRRGYGESRGDPRAAPVRDDAGDLAALLEATDLWPAHLVAHSYAAAVAFRLAVDRPELVRSLAVHEPPFLSLVGDDPTLGTEAAGIRETIHRLQASVRGGRPAEAIAGLAPLLTSGGGPVAPALERALTPFALAWAEEFDDPAAFGPTAGELAAFDLPVLVTSGSESPPLLRAVAERTAGHLANAHWSLVSDAGHNPQLTDPDRFVALLGLFLLERNVPVH